MIVCRFPLCASHPSPVAKHTISSHSSHCKQVALMTLKAFFCDYCAWPGGIMVTVVDSQSVYLVSAFLAVSSQSAATSSTECNFCGHHHQACLLDTRLLLCDLVSTTPVRKPPPAHLCRFAAQRPWPVWKQFSTHHIQRVGAVMPYGR